MREILNFLKYKFLEIKKNKLLPALAERKKTVCKIFYKLLKYSTNLFYQVKKTAHVLTNITMSFITKLQTLSDLRLKCFYILILEYK